MISKIQNFFGLKSTKTFWIYLSSLVLTAGLVFATTVLISSGAKSATLPQLEGLTPDEVSVIAEDYKLAVKYVWIDSNSPKGQVTKQVPEAGDSVQPGDTITIFLSKGKKNGASETSKPGDVESPESSEESNQQNKGTPVTNNQAPNSGKNPPAPTAPKKPSPPDPTRPWLTQEQIDANVAQRAEIVGRFNNQLAYVQSLQSARDAKEAEKWTICNPPVREGYNFQPCLDMGPVLDQMNANIETQLRVLESINAELQNGTWY